MLFNVVLYHRQIDFRYNAIFCLYAKRNTSIINIIQNVFNIHAHIEKCLDSNQI